MRFELVKELKSRKHSTRLCCHLLGVVQSSFYGWTNRSPSKRKIDNKKLSGKIVDIFENSKKSYGYPRVYNQLKRQGEVIGRNKVARLMRLKGLKAVKRKAFVPRTTVNSPGSRKSPRVFKIEDFQVKRENGVWASDLTYLPLVKGFCYLVVVMDLYNREVKGWDLSESMESSQTRKALFGAVRSSSGSLRGTIFHSRGFNIAQRSSANPCVYLR